MATNYIIEIIGPHGVKYRQQDTLTDARRIAYSNTRFDGNGKWSDCRLHKEYSEIGKTYIDGYDTMVYADFVKHRSYVLNRDGTLGRRLV